LTLTGVIEARIKTDLGGIVVATLLTLLFLPAFYVAWYRLKEPTSQANA
jgi:Cu/Ag efflux pump CusA